MRTFSSIVVVCLTAACGTAPEQPPPPQGFDQSIIFFDSNSTELKGTAQTQIMQTAKAARVQNARKVYIRAHADASGGKTYNLALSQRRGDAVKAALVEQGLPAEMLDVKALGDSQLLVPTPKKEPQNRRVEITMD